MLAHEIVGINDLLYLALMLLAAHWVADYPLQGDYLARTKAEGPLRLYHLIAHAGIHGGAVALVTGQVWLGIAEWVAHAIIDELKVRKQTSFATDQTLHLVCKAIWIAVLTV